MERNIDCCIKGVNQRYFENFIKTNIYYFCFILTLLRRQSNRYLRRISSQNIVSKPSTCYSVHASGFETIFYSIFSHLTLFYVALITLGLILSIKPAKASDIDPSDAQNLQSKGILKLDIDDFVYVDKTQLNKHKKTLFAAKNENDVARNHPNLQIDNFNYNKAVEFPLSYTQDKSKAWIITKDHWSYLDEKNFSFWINKIYASQCSRVHECLADKNINFYANKTPKEFFTRLPAIDCGRFPYIMRAYFAWMNNLPYTYAIDIEKRDSNDKRDLRYTILGNKVSKRFFVIQKNEKSYPNAIDVITGITINDSNNKKHSLGVAVNTWTPHYRIPIYSEGYLEWKDNKFTKTNSPKADRMLSDFYFPKISKRNISVGDPLYSPDGHAGMVGNIQADGNIIIFDSTTDPRSVVQRKNRYDLANYPRRKDGLGYGGIMKWRPFKIINYKKNLKGEIIGGDYLISSGHNINDFSTESFDNSVNSNNQHFDWVKNLLANDGHITNPFEWLKTELASMCDLFKLRLISVEGAILNKIDKLPQPEKLPANIFSGPEIWESYATPGRDTKFKALINQIYFKIVKWLGENKKDLVNFKNNLSKVYKQQNEICKIAYTNSNNNFIKLNLDDIMDRVWYLSFDPYHCIERRWGANKGNEFYSCEEFKIKERWYNAEQDLRNLIQRNPENIGKEKTIIDLEKEKGSIAQPDIDFRKLF